MHGQQNIKGSLCILYNQRDVTYIIFFIITLGNTILAHEKFIVFLT